MSIDLNLEAIGLPPLVSRLNGASGIIQRHLMSGVSDAGRYVERGAKDTAPVVTGEYRRGIGTQASAIGGGGAQAIVRASAPHSKWVEDGRGPVVARGKALRFEVGGRVVFAKRVRAARGQHIMRNALSRNRSRIIARLQRAGRDAAAEIAGGGA